MRPILSVIIPVYNIERYLADCLDSIISQTLSNIEIILVDDGSVDDSPNICNRYAEINTQIKVIHQNNKGAGMARNAGLEIAAGEYITFADGDDYIDSTTFEYLLGVMITNELDAIRLSYNKFIRKGEFSNSNYEDKIDIFSTKEDIRQIQMSLFSRPYDKKDKDINLGGSPWGIIIKSDIIKRNNIRFMSERDIISEDYIFNYECLNYIKKIGKSYNTFYHYRITPNSITRSPKLDNIIRTVATSNLMTNKFLKDGFEHSSKFYAMGFCIDVTRVHLKNVFISRMSIKDKLSWAKQQAHISYFSEIYREYPWRNLPIKHKLGFYLFCNSHIKTLYCLIVGQEKIRALMKK